MKGLASLGVLSFIKVIFALSPWHWWNLRSTGIVGGGRGTTGRDRISSISWVVVLIGAMTFLWVSPVVEVNHLHFLTKSQAVYKGVRAFSRRTLEKAGERIIDVPLADEDDEDEVDEAEPSSHTNEGFKKDN